MKRNSFSFYREVFSCLIGTDKPVLFPASFSQTALRPSRNISIQYGMEHAFFGSRVVFVQLTEKLFCILTLGISVYRAFAFYNRKIIFVFESDHVHLVYEHKRPDHGEIHTIKICFRGKRMESAYKLCCIADIYC